MSNLAAIAAIAVHLLAFQNGVCYQACRAEGYNTGRFAYYKKTAYCDCTSRLYYEDMTARPFNLQMRQDVKNSVPKDERGEDNQNVQFDLFNGFHSVDD